MDEMMKSEDYLERGDEPAKAVLRANAEQQALRQAIETQEELQKIRDRVCITLSAYEIGEELRQESQNNVEQIKNAFVKDDAELEFVDDMTKLYLILSDPIAKRKYQQKVTIFVVGYENLCSHRNKLLLQLEEFFKQSTEDSSSFVVDIPDFDFDEVEKNVSDALCKAEKATERLANISKEVLKIFELVNPKDHKKGKKKLEKALFQSHQDVMNLTEKLVGVQSDLEDAKTKLNALNKQVELKEVEVERLKLQVNTNKAFEKESDDLRKALEAKEQQLQSYRVQMDEFELSLSQVENKYDHYVEKYKNLKEENQKLTEEMEKISKEQQQKIIETRKDLELKYDHQVNQLKENQEELIVKLKQSHEEEVKNLREKIDLMRKSSASLTQTAVPSAVTTPLSRDSAVHEKYSSSMMSEHSQTLTMRSSAKIVKTLTDLKSSVSSRLNTASSQVSLSKEKDSVLDSSSTLFVSMTNTPTPSTPKTTETQRRGFAPGSRDVSAVKKTREISSQTEDNIELIDCDDERQVKSRNDMQEIEVQLSKTPSHELPQKMEEYKNKFMEIEQQLQEEVLQWKLRFNSKSQALNQLFLTREEDMKEKEHIMEQLLAAQEQQAQAEKETEQAILQLEELRAEKEGNLDEDFVSSGCIATENKSTATSASLLRRQDENQVKMEDRLQSPGDLFLQQSVAIQCPSAHASRKPSVVSPQYSDLADEEDGVSGIPQSDSGFESSGHVLLSKSPDENYERNKDLVSQNIDDHPKESLRPQVSVPASPRVRSRLVRSALKDHRVVSETIKTFEMITEFKMNITFWLQQHGLENKSDLLASLPEITLDKTDELDVLSKMPLIRDHTRQVLDALWQVTKDDYPWPEHDENPVENGDGDDDRISSRLDHSSPTKEEQEMDEGKLVVDIDTRAVEKIPACSVQPDRQSSHSLRRTTPKGYTHLLHEYNNLNEEYNKLQEQLRESLKSYHQQTNQNATVMNEMQETINNLRWQLLEGSDNTRQALISSVMFTRLDAERNVKTMKRAIQSKRLSQDSFNDVVKQMNQYVDLPGRRFVELVKRYRHHCIMKEVEENLHPSRVTSDAVYNLQEKMEHLQRIRAQKWSEKMAEMSQQRSMLSEGITSCLNDIEGDSGIFLIKPVYSYSSRLEEVEKPSRHPIICKKRIEIVKKCSGPPRESSKKPTYSMEKSRSENIKQGSGRPMWISNESHVSGMMASFHNDPIPRLLAMDVNRIMLNRNPVSEFINTKSGDGHSLSGVRQYITVERPIGVTSAAQHNSDVVSAGDSLPVASRSPSPSLSLYSTLPPINLPHQQRSSTMSAYTNQSVSSLSMTSFDDTFAR